jgi:aspartate/tyrosine/aromatic aminotransferase
MERNIFLGINAMFSWSSMSRHELKNKLGKKMLIPKNNTSNPYVQGAHIVTNVIGDPTMFDEWSYGMQAIASQIKTICQRLYDEFFYQGQQWQD